MDKQQKHIPVLTKEVIESLDVKPKKVYVDATLGGGGHTRAILEQNSSCKVIGLDWDKSVIDEVGMQLQEEFQGRFFPVWGNFAKIHELIKKVGFDQVDGILADFGTSQIQIGNTPGLSIYQDAFLDMRMSSAHFRTTAYDVVNTFSANALADIFYTYGEERQSRKIARLIEEERKKNKITTTGQLAKLIESIIPRYGAKIHPATRVFQALRIFVNKELENIQAFLQNDLRILKNGGRLVCISFHSLEDRIVKQFFKNCSQRNNPEMYFEMLQKGVSTATEEEISQNRSSRSARLRAGILHKTV